MRSTYLHYYMGEVMLEPQENSKNPKAQIEEIRYFQHGLHMLRLVNVKFTCTLNELIYFQVTLLTSNNTMADMLVPDSEIHN